MSIGTIMMLCFRIGATGMFTGFWIGSLYLAWTMRKELVKFDKWITQMDVPKD